MRVKISYETELENVPEELSTLVAKSQNQHLQKAAQDLIEAFEELKREENPNLGLADEKIESARKKLFRADSLLSDVSGILKGYQKVLVDPDFLDPDPLEAEPTKVSPEAQTVKTDETLQAG